MSDLCDFGMVSFVREYNRGTVILPRAGKDGGYVEKRIFRVVRVLIVLSMRSCERRMANGSK